MANSSIVRSDLTGQFCLPNSSENIEPDGQCAPAWHWQLGNADQNRQALQSTSAAIPTGVPFALGNNTGECLSLGRPVVLRRYCFSSDKPPQPVDTLRLPRQPVNIVGCYASMLELTPLIQVAVIRLFRPQQLDRKCREFHGQRQQRQHQPLRLHGV